MSPAPPPLRIFPDSPSWPAGLDGVEPAPTELWLRGREELLLHEPRIALVGTRSPTPYGEAQARRFARGLCEAGFVVVSGLARGVDAAAHEGALEAGGGTLAVLGCGVDRPWPAGALAETLGRQGLLVSEYPPGQGPRRHHFPLRNRLIAGLSCAVVVIEAAQGSGSLITARWGLDQGRTIFALPGRVDQPMAAGCLRLLRDGATPVGSPRDVVEELFGRAPAASKTGAQALPGDALLTALVGETLAASELAARLGRSLDTVLVELIEHELGGRVARCPGGLWRLHAEE